MDPTDKDAVIKKIKERIRRGDRTLKIEFLAHNFFIGNFAALLRPNTGFTITSNSSGKLSCRFILDANPLVGYSERDIGVTLTQACQIMVKDEHMENAPVIVFSLKPETLEKIFKMQTGLKETVESTLRENRRFAQNLIFILKPWDDLEGFVKIMFQDQQQKKEYCFDFDVGRDILQEDVCAVWKQMIYEQHIAKQSALVSLPDHLVPLMTEGDWTEKLIECRLKKVRNPDGSVGYVKVENRPYERYDIKKYNEYNNKSSEEKFDSRGTHPDNVSDKSTRPTKKRKMENIINSKRTCWVNREGWIREQPEFTTTSMTFEKLNGTGVGIREFVIGTMHLNRMIEKTSSENENIPKFQGSNGKKVQFDMTHALQNSNGLNALPSDIAPIASPSKTAMQADDVDVVIEGMSHLGEEVPNVEMQSVSEVPDRTVQVEQNATNIIHPPNPAGDNAGRLLDSGLTKKPIKNADDIRSRDARNSNTGLSQGDSSVPSAKPKHVRPVAPQRSRTPPPNTESVVLVFPPRGLDEDTVALRLKDMKTLDRKEFVNDNIMFFMLKYITHYMMEKDLRDQLFMISTFFYTNLVRNLPPMCFSQRRKVDPAHEKLLVSNSARAVRWTKKFDLFAKHYIVIPVNEDLHWMVMAVINPGGAIVDMSDEKKSRSAPQTYILFYDPLSGLDPSRRNHMCHVVSIYLSVVYELTKAPGKKHASGNPTIYDKSRVTILRPNNTPIQDNFFDCGLYALHFVEGLFCSPNRPVTVKDIPEFDWTKMWPEANKMCDLMRDKVYNLIRCYSSPEGRSRLDKYEKYYKSGLNREGKLRKARRHSAVNSRRMPRHEDYYPRHYSISPPSKNVIYDDPLFANPRGLASMPLTQRVRRLKLPEENFPIAY